MFLLIETKLHQFSSKFVLIVFLTNNRASFVFICHLFLSVIIVQLSQKNQYCISRGVINGKAGKAAALPKFSETYVNPISTRRGRLRPPIGFALT